MRFDMGGLIGAEQIMHKIIHKMINMRHLSTHIHNLKPALKGRRIIAQANGLGKRVRRAETGTATATR
jgi:hypothetical protein